MSYHQFPAYEGPENYIFISYSHKDTEKVLPIMEKLRELGCRIWYDEGIVPGSEWPEDIAQHLNRSAMVIAFISPNSMASVNCRREINFALSKQKPFLSVVLEPTEMPLGMELQLSTQQSVLRYNFRTEEQFIDKICACPDLACCQEAPKQPEPVPVAEAAPEQTPEPEIAVAPEKPAAEPMPEVTKTKSPKVSGKLLGIAACVLVLVAALLIFLFAAPKTGEPEDSAGTTEAPAVQTQPVETEPARTEPVQTEPEGVELVVHVRLPKYWTSASLWAWSDSDGRKAFDTWPGQPLKKGADGWYIATVPAWVNRVSIVSPDGEFESMYTAVRNRDIWLYMREDGIVQSSQDGPFVGTIKVRAKIDTWTKLYCWAWTADGDVFEAWPGKAMVNTGNWYTIDLPCDTIGVKFSDGATGSETEDLMLEPGWDIWFVERYGYYVWDYQEYTEDKITEIFASLAP